MTPCALPAFAHSLATPPLQVEGDAKSIKASTPVVDGANGIKSGGAVASWSAADGLHLGNSETGVGATIKARSSALAFSLLCNTKRRVVSTTQHLILFYAF